jgi:AraC-like DNA-binding protein
MPQFQVTRAVATRDVSATRVVCDGCDPARPCDEHTERGSLWMITAGAFELRDARGRHVVDPSRAIAMPRGHAIQIRHPAGPDVCIALHGPMVDALVRDGVRPIAVSPAQTAQVIAALDSHQDDGDELALGEALAHLVPAGQLASAPDRDLCAAVGDALRTRYAERTSLRELAAVAGYSVFHLCRVFRAQTGTTIHGFRRELRLHHALARLLDGSEPLAEIALGTGFASQSHLTNQFRARFGITPARARSRDGRRLLGQRGQTGQTGQTSATRGADRIAPGDPTGLTGQTRTRGSRRRGRPAAQRRSPPPQLPT